MVIFFLPENVPRAGDRVGLGCLRMTKTPVISTLHFKCVMSKGNGGGLEAKYCIHACGNGDAHLLALVYSMLCLLCPSLD